ncbi:MAG: hypothetical protein ORN49_12470 [Rhodobacteraceae bacterium]|nr:hypothetical protein [Paracoccaceae bacterium]
MRHFPLIGLLAAFPAVAQTDSLSQNIGKAGLAATEAQLAALPTPTDADRFALGGVRFLRTGEVALQAQIRDGLIDPTGLVPFLGLGVADSMPPAGLSQPDAIRTLLTTALNNLENARAPLDDIAPDADFRVELDLKDLWFDLNADGKRAPEEEALNLLGPAIMGWRWSERDPAAPAPIVRFDAADVAWLSAYTHLLQGLSTLVLAYDPTDAITRSRAAQKKMTDLSAPGPDDFGLNGYFTQAVDSFAVTYWALDQKPDAGRMSAVRAHLQAMVADNRRFWTMVAAETDNDHEWLPNDHQTSALGVTVPQGTGALWLAVLDDLDALLSGKKLFPYWRLGDGAGVNVARFFADPVPIDLVGWVQGEAAIPYLEKGPLVSSASWNAFANLLEGDSVLFSIYLN